MGEYFGFALEIQSSFRQHIMFRDLCGNNEYNLNSFKIIFLILRQKLTKLGLIKNVTLCIAVDYLQISRLFFKIFNKILTAMSILCYFCS